MKTVKKMIALSVLVALSTSIGGCAMFRAAVGMGAGIGADVKIPALLHAGAGVGTFQHVGTHYGRPAHKSWETSANFVLWHWEGDLSEPVSVDHACAGLFPPLTSYDENSDDIDGWSLEIGLMLGVIDLRLGFNPMGSSAVASEEN